MELMGLRISFRNRFSNFGIGMEVMRSDFAFGGGADGSGMMDVEADMISEGV
jgi:hypothetical protein